MALYGVTNEIFVEAKDEDEAEQKVQKVLQSAWQKIEHYEIVEVRA